MFTVTLSDNHLSGKSAGWRSLHFDTEYLCCHHAKTQTRDPFDSLYIYIYLYIYIFRRKNLHIVTLNSKLLHFGQELQFDRGRSFDESINRGPFQFNTDFLFLGKASTLLLRPPPPLHSHGQTSSCQIVLFVHHSCTFCAPILCIYCPFPAVAILYLFDKMNCTLQASSSEIQDT